MLTILLFLAASCFGSVNASYELQNSFVDSSGNSRDGGAINGGPVFVKSFPLPAYGGYSAVFNSTQGITVPNSIYTGMTTTGQIRATFYSAGNQGDLRLVYSSINHGSYGNSYFGWLGGAWKVDVPTTGSTKEYTDPYTLRHGRWYTFIMTWTPTRLKTYWVDHAAGNTPTVSLDVDMTANPPMFAWPSVCWIGNYSGAPSAYHWEGALSRIEWRTDITVTDIKPYADEWVLMEAGHSYVSGISPLFDTFRSYAYAFFQASQAHISFGGTYYSDPKVISNGHAGVAGSKTSDMNSTIAANLAATFPSTSKRTAVIVGGILQNDCSTGVLTITTRTNLDQTIDKILAYLPDSPIFLMTDCARTTAPTNIETYNAVMRSVYADRKALGQNVFLLDIYPSKISLLSDGLHPDPLGNYTYARDLCGKIMQGLFGARSTPPIPSNQFFKTQ